MFAPTDEAFAKLPKGTVETLLKPENKYMLQGILKYHVIPGRLMAEHVVRSDGAVSLTGLQNHREWQTYVAEIKSLGQRFGDPEYQDMAVLSLYLAALHDHEAVFLGQRRIVGFEVVLSVFCQHKTVNRDVLAANPLTVIFDLGAAIV